VISPNDAAEPGDVPESSYLRDRRGHFAGALVVLTLLVAAAVWWHSPRDGAKPPGTADRVPVVGLPERTVAVMPFDDLSLQHDNGQLALALPEMVLQRLGSIKDLIVIARSSSFAFIGSKWTHVTSAGSSMPASWSKVRLQRVADRLRITAQLVDAQTGKQLKAMRIRANPTPISRSTTVTTLPPTCPPGRNRHTWLRSLPPRSPVGTLGAPIRLPQLAVSFFERNAAPQPALAPTAVIVGY